MKKIITGMLLLLLTGSAGFAARYTVASVAEFTEAAKRVTPGDVIIIKNGTYSGWAVTLYNSGTAAQPVTVMAQSAGKVIFTGDVLQPVFSITTDYTRLEGISFTGCVLNKAAGKSGLLIDLGNTRNSSISYCTFTQNTAKAQFMPLVTISGKGSYNQVNHCTFTANTNTQDLQVKITKDACPVYTLITDNVFKDKQKVSWPVFNGGECVQIGQDPVLLGNAEAQSTVRNNRFIRCNAEPEVISNKSSGNRYINNYFEGCDGELVMRGGHNCLIDSNRFNGGKGGIRINGSGHTVTHNTITGVKTGIRLMYGMARGKSQIGFYVAATNCNISYNTISNTETGILVGDGKNEDWTGKFDTSRYPSRVMQDVPPADNVFKDNTFNATAHTIIYQ